MTEDQFKLFDSLTAKQFNINPLYIKISGSVTAGYFLTQLGFLYRAFDYKEFWRTDKQLCEDYCLTLEEVMGNRKKLIKLGLISVERKGVPAKLHYTINISKIIELATALGNPSYGETQQQDMGKPNNRRLGKPITLNNDLKKERKEKQQQKASLNPKIPPSVDDPVVVSFLDQIKDIGLDPEVSLRLIEEYGLDRFGEVVKIARTSKPKVPGAFIREGLKKGWKPNASEESSSESPGGISNRL